MTARRASRVLAAALVLALSAGAVLWFRGPIVAWYDRFITRDMFVAQDGDNRPHAQNFKLVSWQAILEAVRR